MSESAYATRRPRRERRQSAASAASRIPGLNQTRRSWTTPGGMHCSFEATTYTSPGFAFSTGGGSSRDLFENFAGPSRSRRLPTGTGLVGGALNLLDGLLSSQRQRDRRFDAPRHDGRGHRMPYVEEHEETDSELDSDDGLAYGTTPRSADRPRSMFGKIRDRLLEGGRQQSSRDDEPFDRPLPQRRATERQYDQARPGQYAHVRDQTQTKTPRRPSSENGYREYMDATSRPSQRSDEATAELETLSHDVERKQRRYSESKRRFQRASQGTMIDSVHLRNLLDDVQLRERSLARAEQRLRDAQSFHRSGRARAASQDRTRPPMSRRSSARTESEYGEDDDDVSDEDWHNAGFRTFFDGPRHQDPMFQVFDELNAFDSFGHDRAFNRMFGQMSGGGFAFHDGMDGFHFHTIPGGSIPKQPRRNAGGRSSSYQQQPFTPNSATASRAPPRPSNALRADEAVRLFQTYNSRWLALSPISADIPYPTRSLQATALSDSSTLPHAASHAFSAEQIMQANAQVFFLLAVGIKPEISDNGMVSYNRYAPGETKTKELVEILKKEKVRWHSDRLGRRNEGSGGVNEALQRDERARAVFHGVCALMVYALGRT